MEKISNWSIGGFIYSILFGIVSFVRYYLLYPDIDKFLAYMTLALLVAGVSWLFNSRLLDKAETKKRLDVHEYSITAIEEHFQDELSGDNSKSKLNFKENNETKDE